jgi:hypothetical protein
MPLYEFNNQFTACPKTGHPHAGELETRPQIIDRPTAVKQLSDIQQGRTKIFGELPGTDPEYVEEYLIQGFRSLDEAMKNYWSGMRIPVKDSYRFMRVKVAGGDKSLLIWRDQLREGRVRLPVGSLSRTGHEFNPDKFSPAYLPMALRYTSNRMDRVAKVYRPVPYLVSYDLVVWANYKRDADYILHQVLTRFNPLAEFTMWDKHLQGNIQLRFEGSTDASDKEIGFDQRAKIRYEYKMTAEAWLPLPETIVPTVKGHVTVFKEVAGDIERAVSEDIMQVSLGNYNNNYVPTGEVE